MATCGVAFLMLIVLPATPLCPAELRAPALGLALAFYHLYFSQLYCEAHVGAHVTVLLPPALLLMALSPALDPDASARDAASRPAAPKALTARTAPASDGGAAPTWLIISSLIVPSSSV